MEFFQEIFAPAMLPYTVALLAVVGYWLVVILGAADIEFLEALGFGAAEEAGETVGEAANSAGEAAGGALQSIFGFLNFGVVPLTVILSFAILKTWVFAYLIHHNLGPHLVDLAPPIVVGLLTFVVCSTAAVLLTGLTTRPFRKLFKVTTTHGAHHLIGHTCTVRTSKANNRFGQAEMRVNDSFLTLTVRTRDDETLAKGDEAVIVDYDTQEAVYFIRKM